MSDPSWPALAGTLHLEAYSGWLEGTVGPYPAGLTCRGDMTWLGFIVGNPQQFAWTLTRRWEPQARNPRRPDARTVRFRNVHLTERYVGTASEPEWFRAALSAEAADALILAADANRLGSCAVDLRGHMLTARYRGRADAVPDLVETLASLRALAECLDGGAPNLPDLLSTPLCSPQASRDTRHATALQLDDTTLTCTLPKASGLRQKFQSAPRIVIDWATQRVMGPDLDLPLGSIRQVIARPEPERTLLELVDKAGGSALSCAIQPATSLPSTDAAPRTPPFVVAPTEGVG